ncbi:MAG: type II toxin-antitoxin system HicA family toxin [Selenomonadaceae bacterium]|nr:type II toxin-antitoxin system HicA family toxin [Selenomonadaceae bacterium]
MPMTPKEMIRYLQRNGFQKVQGGKGSHQKMKNPITNRITEVPMSKSELDKSLEYAILKQAGLKK